MTGEIPPGNAIDPVPENKASDMWKDTALSWTPGKNAATRNVYLGTRLDDVNDASTAGSEGHFDRTGISGPFY